MKIESSIQRILNQRGKVVVPNLGTFATAQASATVTDSGGVIAPPQAEVIFTEDTSEMEAYSLADYLVTSGEVSESDVELEIEAFVKGVKNTIIASGKAGVGSLGYFQQVTRGLKFVATNATNIGADSFGLPKIAARPLVPVPISDNAATTGAKGDNLLLKAILIPLIILCVALVYFLFNQETYQAMMAYFNKPTTEVTVPPVKKPDGNKPTGDTTIPKKTDKNVKGTKKTDGAKQGGDTKKTTTEKKPDATTKTSTGDTNSDVVTSTTSRFYIIIGSFGNERAAKKKVSESKRLGYSEAKVLKMNGKIRVSIEDHEKRDIAITKAAKLGKDFPGAWVLAN